MSQGSRYIRIFRLPGEDGVRHFSLDGCDVSVSGRLDESLFYAFASGGPRYRYDGRLWRSSFCAVEEARAEFQRQIDTVVVQGATEMVFDGRQYIPRPRPRHRADKAVRMDIRRFRAEATRAMTAVRQDPLFASTSVGALEQCFHESHLRDGYLTFLQRQNPRASRGAPFGSHVSLYSALLAAQRTLGGRQRSVRRHRGALRVEAQDALFHHGDLVISGDAHVEGALAITGNLQVEGALDVRGSAGKVLTLGHASAERMIVSASAVVGGNLLLGSLLYLFDKASTLRVRQRIVAPLLLQHGGDLLALRGHRGEKLDLERAKGREALQARGLARGPWGADALADQLIGVA